jgi:phosphoserine phosphatase
MDGTLLQGRGIFVIAEKMGFLDELIALIKDDTREYYIRSIDVAQLSKGKRIDDMLEIFRNVPLQDNAQLIIKELKKNGIKTGIATDSYKVFADDLKQRLSVDFTFANDLKIDDGIVTGDLEIHNKDLTADFISGEIYSICKSCVLERLCDDLNISLDQAIAVGDGIVDIGMIKKAGLGIAFNTKDKVNKYADIVTNDLRVILDYI